MVAPVGRPAPAPAWRARTIPRPLEAGRVQDPVDHARGEPPQHQRRRQVSEARSLVAGRVPHGEPAGRVDQPAHRHPQHRGHLGRVDDTDRRLLPPPGQHRGDREVAGRQPQPRQRRRARRRRRGRGRSPPAPPAAPSSTVRRRRGRRRRRGTPPGRRASACRAPARSAPGRDRRAGPCRPEQHQHGRVARRLAAVAGSAAQERPRRRGVADAVGHGAAPRRAPRSPPRPRGAARRRP